VDVFVPPRKIPICGVALLHRGSRKFFQSGFRGCFFLRTWIPGLGEVSPAARGNLALCPAAMGSRKRYARRWEGFTPRLGGI
jgi:hypothetical protein